jgi:hypothetical protein
VFFLHGIQGKGKILRRTNVVMGITLFNFAINNILNLIYPYFSIIDIDLRKWFYLMVSWGTVFGVCIIEPLYRKNRTYSIIIFGTAIVNTIISPDSDYLILAIMITFFVILFGVKYLQFLLQKTEGKTKIQIKSVMFFLSLFFIASMMDFDWIQTHIPWDGLMVLGYFFALVSLIGIYYNFSPINVLTETGWRDHLESIYIISKITNESIFYKNIKITKNQINSPSQYQSSMQSDEINSIFSSGLVGIDSLIREITNSENSLSDMKNNNQMTSIAKEGKYILMKHMPNVIICIIIDQQMENMQYFLEKICNSWDEYYGSQIENWDKLDSSTFMAMNVIVDQLLNEN